jgi:hypothetical protein
MNYLIKLSVFAIVFLAVNTYSIELANGVTKGQPKWGELTKTDYDAGFYPSAVVETDQEGVVYVYDGGLGRTNYVLSQLLGNWPLTRWPHQYFSPDVEAHYKELHHPYPLPFDYEGVGPGVGCMGDSPLRFGDLEEDGPKEIVIMLNGLFMVFSPQYERIVFAEPLDESDWMTKEEMTQFFSQKPVTSVQYTSRVLAENDVIDAGVRAYAKLYVGNFDGDSHQDIVVWRKSYRSNAGSNPVLGFTKLGDVYQHFERDLAAQSASPAGLTGEYLPMETTESTIKQWLSGATQTWSSGYPSTSECTGQEGQLIPEMHDPLLNDPDVLIPVPVVTP